VRCERARLLLPALVDGSAGPSRIARAHVARCLRCQAELAHYRRVQRAARVLASRPRRAPADLLEAVLVGVETWTAPRQSRGRWAIAGLGGLAAGAAGAGAVVLTRRSRRWSR
jgi:anti-sigma factor RsiW